VSRRVPTRLVLICLTLGALPGCYHLMHDAGEPMLSRVEAMEGRDLHYGEVLRKLGPPSSLTATSTGFAFLYEHIASREWQVGVSLGFPLERIGVETQLPMPKLTLASGSEDAQTFVAEFDREGKMVASSFSRREESLGWGFGLTPPLVTRDLVGAGASNPRRQNRWGMALLRRLQYTLNAHQDLDAGTHGLEQSGTPVSVGQRTLEWVDQNRSRRKGPGSGSP
jgi:hypothetical protein